MLLVQSPWLSLKNGLWIFATFARIARMRPTFSLTLVDVLLAATAHLFRFVKEGMWIASKRFGVVTAVTAAIVRTFWCRQSLLCCRAASQNRSVRVIFSVSSCIRIAQHWHTCVCSAPECVWHPLIALLSRYSRICRCFCAYCYDQVFPFLSTKQLFGELLLNCHHPCVVWCGC
jgi:hypothetical protein